MISIHSSDFAAARLISRVLMMYYRDHMSQAEIGKALGLSAAKINRLLKQAREQGMVEIQLHTPLQHIIEIERKIETALQVAEAIVVPQDAQDEAGVLRSVGRAAAQYFLDHLQDGDIVCVGGGHSLYELVQSIRTNKIFNVKIVPAIGGVQGRHYTDVNYLAAELARRVGGTAYQLHAPAFVDSAAEREAMLTLRHVREILHLARQSRIALLGVGSLLPGTSSYFEFTSLPPDEAIRIAQEEGGVGEIWARIYNKQGKPVALKHAERVIGLELGDLLRIPLTVSVAALPHKALPIAGALRGKYLKTLITDEVTGKEILAKIQEI